MNLGNKKKNSFWQRVRFKYKLSLLDESSLDEVFSLRLSQLTAIFVAGLVLVLLFILATFIIVGTPLRSYLPGYLDAGLRSNLVDYSVKLDSLIDQNERREAYLANIQLILSGEMIADSIMPADSLFVLPSDSLAYRTRSEREEGFVARFEEEEKYNLTILNPSAPAEGVVFYPPVRGVVTAQFDPLAGRYGVEIACAKKATIATPLAGTIVFVGYTMDAQYVMQIQHGNEYLSVFKNIEQPIKNTNEKVAAGSVVGFVSAKGNGVQQPVISYELWHRGAPLNPTEYIKF